MTTTETIKAIETALMAIIEMDDIDTFDEQIDCIEALRKLQRKLKHKEQTNGHISNNILST